MSVDEKQLQEWVGEAASRLEVPGVAVGVLIDGQEQYAFHGVTSVENPLPVDEHTLFQFGSTGKTFTATALMRLVERGQVDLDERVKTYIPEFRLRDRAVENEVRVLQLLNHTAGWSGDILTNTGDGDDAFQKYIALLADAAQETPLGTAVSYNNASLVVAGRIIEVVTGMTYEQAMKTLIFEPLGLSHMFFFPNEIMTRRFAVGHVQKPDGSIVVSRPWAMPRSGSPAGGISSNSGDLIAWARFHLGDGSARDGSRVLSKELLDRMKEPTFDMRGSALGDYVGIAWLMRDVDGVRLVSHGGDTIGQHSDFVMVPERGFAISTLTNSGPNGGQFNDEVVTWALQTYLGVVDRDPEPLRLGDADLAKYVGHYETVAALVDVVPDDGGLLLKIKIKPEVLEQLREEGQESDLDQEQPPIAIGMLPGDEHRYIVTGGPAKGMKGYFARDASGAISGVHAGGRMAAKTRDTVSA